MRNKLLGTFLLLCSAFYAGAQYSSLNAHSHNDYEQKTPFFLAYNANFGSIEADIWAINGELFVAHNKEQVTESRTLDKLYLQPIVLLFKTNGGKAWKNSSATFELLIDLKTEVEPTLSLLVEKLKKYPEVFDPAVNRQAVRVVITGNRPAPELFRNYPAFIFFDGNVTKKYNAEELKRVGLFSENLSQFTTWRGKDAMAEKEEFRLKQIIDSVHGLNKKIRFWNAADHPEAWKLLMNLKVDFINTDHIAELSTFLKTNKN